MLGVVGDEVVDVVAAFPPADGEAAAKVGDEDANEGVGDEVMGDAPMAGVVGGEHDLMLLIIRWIGSETGLVGLPRISLERLRMSCTIQNVERRRTPRTERYIGLPLLHTLDTCSHRSLRS